MAGTQRQVSARLTLAGQPLAVTSATVEQVKSAGQGSTFKASVPLASMEAVGLGLAWLATASSPDASVTFTVDGNDTLMFTGKLDSASVRLTTGGEVVSLSGRDSSADLKDKKTNEKFVNQRSEDIAAQVAARHGLTLKTDGGTKTAGKIYTAEQAKVTGNQSEWTLLRQLAEAEGKVVYVGPNKTLVFRKSDDPTLPTYPVRYIRAQGQAPQSNASSLTLSRNFQAAQTTTVTTSSWDHKQQKLVTSTKTSPAVTPSVAAGTASETVASAQASRATSAPTVSASTTAGTSSQVAASAQASQVYAYNQHHMTQEQADAHAASKVAEHTRHEFDVTLTMPGDTTVTAEMLISLSGTGSGFDQNYNVDSASHVISGGTYVMTLSTKSAGKGRKVS